jgi:DnaJ-class molecular chaperone
MNAYTDGVLYEEGRDWRLMNESRMAADDCRKCSGMGSVPTETTDHGHFTSSAYGPCPACGGSGKILPVTLSEIAG